MPVRHGEDQELNFNESGAVTLVGDFGPLLASEVCGVESFL